VYRHTRDKTLWLLRYHPAPVSCPRFVHATRFHAFSHYPLLPVLLEHAVCPSNTGEVFSLADILGPRVPSPARLFPKQAGLLHPNPTTDRALLFFLLHLTIFVVHHVALHLRQRPKRLCRLDVWPCDPLYVCGDGDCSNSILSFFDKGVTRDIVILFFSALLRSTPFFARDTKFVVLPFFAVVQGGLEFSTRLCRAHGLIALSANLLLSTYQAPSLANFPGELLLFSGQFFVTGSRDDYVAPCARPKMCPHFSYLPLTLMMKDQVVRCELNPEAFSFRTSHCSLQPRRHPLLFLGYGRTFLSRAIKYPALRCFRLSIMRTMYADPSMMMFYQLSGFPPCFL